MSEIFVAEGESGVVDHLLDALFLGLGADEQHVAGVGNDVVCQAVDHDELLAADGEDVAGGVVGQHVAVLGDVGVAVLGGVVIEGAPCAEVVPSERDAFDIDVFGFLHDGEVDGDAHASREVLVDEFLLLGGGEESDPLLEAAGHVGGVGLQLADDGLGAPEEDT